MEFNFCKLYSIKTNRFDFPMCDGGANSCFWFIGWYHWTTICAKSERKMKLFWYPTKFCNSILICLIFYENLVHNDYIFWVFVYIITSSTPHQAPIYSKRCYVYEDNTAKRQCSGWIIHKTGQQYIWDFRSPRFISSM